MAATSSLNLAALQRSLATFVVSIAKVAEGVTGC